MKKNYIAPTTDVLRYITDNGILTSSILDPEEWGGGGGAGSRYLEVDDNFEFINHEKYELD